MLDQPLSEDEALLKKKCCPLEAFSIMCWELWQILKLCTVHQTRDTCNKHRLHMTPHVLCLLVGMIHQGS